MSKRRPARVSPRLETAAEHDVPVIETPARTSLTRELTRVEEVNLAFYEAFHRRDVERMGRVWSRSPYARCIHPGWEPVVGWPIIRQSWVEIFESMRSIEFELESVHVEVVDRSAWINLIAHASVTTEDDETFQTSVIATTMFEKQDDEWLIVLHHSSHFLDDDELDEEEDDEIDLDGLGGAGTPFKPN